MMEKAGLETARCILDYLQRDVANALYMYIDIATYGLASPELDVWVEMPWMGTGWVAMRYHDSIQLYHSNTEAALDIVLPVLQQENPCMISGPKKIVLRLIDEGFQSYSATFGKVFTFSGILPNMDTTAVECATTADLPEIAALICSDQSIGGHYRVGDLAYQLKERMDSGTGRNVVVRRDGRIVAHYATYAEMGGLAVQGGLITHPDWRGRGFGRKLVSYLTAWLIEEGKQVFLFCTDEALYPFYECLGMQPCAEYGKLVKKGVAY